MKSIIILIISLIILTGCLNQRKPDQTTVQGSDSLNKTKSIKKEVISDHSPDFPFDYLGETPPGSVPKIFAPEIISTDVDESCFEVSISGEDIIFTREGAIYMMTKGPEGWIDPVVASFSGNDIDGECCFTTDGQKILFASRRLLPGANTPLNTWESQKQENGWNVATPMALPPTDQIVHAVSVSENGNIYFSGIQKMQYKNGKYQETEFLNPALLGAHPFIAPDESYIIFSAPAPNSRVSDLYISFMGSDSLWTQPIPLGDQINSTDQETNAFVTPDGKYLFFTRGFDIYWVKADFIERLASKQ